MVSAVIFDMDGLLVDSEPYWQTAQMDVFTSLGVPLTPELARKLVGLRIYDHIDYWFARYPWVGPSRSEVAAQITQVAMDLIEERAEALPGAPEAVRTLAAARFPLAVASSSGTCVIGLVLEKIGLGEYFQVVQSAEFEPYGKPHPGVYLTTAERLGVPPKTCVAIEDSVNGLLAAKAAGMGCVAVPAPAARHDDRYAVADMVLSSLTELDVDRLQRL